MTSPPLLLHILPGFGTGGAQSRITVLLNRFGDRFRHLIISLNGDVRAAERIDGSIDAVVLGLPVGANPFHATRHFIALLRKWRPELLLTYNWGSIEAVLAAGIIRYRPVIHTEDGFGPDEAVRQKGRRVFIRRTVLRRASRVIAPSKKLSQIMGKIWRLPDHLVTYIPNGVDTRHYTPAGQRGPASREVIIGTAGQLRPEKQYEKLVALCAGLRSSIPVRLRIAGDGPERERIERAAREHDFSNQVEFAGQLTDLRDFYRSLDVFALTSSTEQMPISILEAMGTGLPVVSTDVGDIKSMVCEENKPFITALGAPLADALRRMASDGELRNAIGERNRARCVSSYSLDQMVESYQDLYESVMRRH